MPSLKSNYIRTDITSQCFRYEFQLVSNKPVDSKFYQQIQGYFLSINEFIVFNFPFIYSVDQLKQLKSFNFMLSNGQKVQILILINNTITLNSKEISAQIHKQIMKGTNFLYSQNLQICLNPFEQRKITHSQSLMPGFSLFTQETNGCYGFYLIPLQAKITQFHSLSSLHEHSIILDYNSGSFYKKSSIVRYDKANQLLYFRTGEQLSKNSLKSLQIMPLSGYQLAMKLNNYFKRIKQTQKLQKFILKWELKFDSRFMEVPYNFFPVSHIISRNNDEKSLGQAIGSISSYNFQFPFRKIFSNLTFEDSIRANIYFLVPSLKKQQKKQESIDIQNESQNYFTEYIQLQQQFMLPIISEFQNLKLRINLDQCRIQVFTYSIYKGWVNGVNKTLKQIDQFIEKQKEKDSIDKVFVLTNLQSALRAQKQIEMGSNFNAIQEQFNQPIYKKIINHLISSGTYYHLIDAQQNQFKSAVDIIAIKSFATIYTKLRLNPWKIKDIPFGTKPLIVFSLHVKLQTNGSVLISLIGTLNAYLSKYTCLVDKSTPQQYQQKITGMIKDTIQKFKSIHKCFPMRAMIFRTGDFSDQKNLTEQLQKLDNNLLTTYSCKPSIINLNSNSPLRVYNQIDVNYISKDTVKPTQLLCQLKYNNQRYIQLQMWHPLYKIKIYGVDDKDPSFEQKIVQLTTKLCFTYQIMTQMKFGKGLGFIEYGQKLCNWARKHENSMVGMVNSLKQGLLMFL